MTNLNFEEYQYDALETAYYLDRPLAEQLDVTYFGFNEEVNELLTDKDYPSELTALLWGREIDPIAKSALTTSKMSEAGDVLYYIAAAASLRNVKLGAIATAAVEAYSGESSESIESFNELDAQMKDRMGRIVPTNYSPDYFSMQFWNFPAFENVSTGDLGNLQAVKGPLKFYADSLYSFERVSRVFSEQLSLHQRSDEKFMKASGLVLGGLSVLLQNRVGTTLMDTAHYNMDKRSRRAEMHSLADGWDMDRSRAVGTMRPNFDQFDNTQINLLAATFPDVQ